MAHAERICQSIQLNFGKNQVCLEKVFLMGSVEAADYHFPTRHTHFQRRLPTRKLAETNDTPTAMRGHQEANACIFFILFARTYKQEASICDEICRVSPMGLLKAQNFNLSVDHMYLQLFNFSLCEASDVPRCYNKIGGGGL